LREAAGSTTHAPHGRQLLVIAQVAMTVVLLYGAGLLMRTVLALDGAHAGFDRRDLLTMEVNLPDARFGDGRAVDFFRQARERLRQLPGVESTAGSYSVPVTGGVFSGTGFHILGQPELPDSERPSTAVRVVTPDYFRTLGIPVSRGREFSEADQRPNAERVYLVNEAFASRYLAGEDPLAASVSVSVDETNPYGRIVGVVGDVKEGSLRDRARPTVFFNHGQAPLDDLVLIVRARSAATLTAQATAAIRELDASAAVANVRTIEALLGDSVGRERVTALVSATFALSGLLLAALGLYSLLAFVVAERTKEIGVRMALGARIADVLAGVLRDGLRLVVTGAAIGTAGALAMSRALSFLWFGVGPYDAWTFGGVLLLLLGVALAATLIPARRATHVDPVVALRAE
jgi:predicted permease